jgi:hypothetical protein
MAIEHKVRISEKQRKLIMCALTATMANNRRSTDGGLDATPDEWMELIGVFAALNSHETVAASKNQINGAANLGSADRPAMQPALRMPCSNPRGKHHGARRF